MKAILLPLLFSFALAATLPAQTCREVVPDASGRIVQTIDRQKTTGGSVQANTRTSSESSSATQRDASGRLTSSSTGSAKCPGGDSAPFQLRPSK